MRLCSRQLFIVAGFALAAAGGSLQAQQTERWNLEPSLRIGSIDDSNTAFSHISRVVTDPQEHAFVALTTEGVIRVFDVRGRFVRRLGRAGSDPVLPESLRPDVS